MGSFTKPHLFFIYSSFRQAAGFHHNQKSNHTQFTPYSGCDHKTTEVTYGSPLLNYYGNQYVVYMISRFDDSGWASFLVLPMAGPEVHCAIQRTLGNISVLLNHREMLVGRVKLLSINQSPISSNETLASSRSITIRESFFLDFECMSLFLPSFLPSIYLSFDFHNRPSPLSSPPIHPPTHLAPSYPPPLPTLPISLSTNALTSRLVPCVSG